MKKEKEEWEESSISASNLAGFFKAKAKVEAEGWTVGEIEEYGDPRSSDMEYYAPIKRPIK